MLQGIHCDHMTSLIFWVEESPEMRKSLSLHFLDPCAFAFSEYTSRYNFKLKNKKVYWINSSWLVFYPEQNWLSKLPVQAGAGNGTKPGLEFSQHGHFPVSPKSRAEQSAEQQGWARASPRHLPPISRLNRAALFLLHCFICWFQCALLADFEWKLLCG